MAAPERPASPREPPVVQSLDANGAALPLKDPAQSSSSIALPTIPSDEDRTSEDDSHRASSSPRRGRSDSSSNSEPLLHDEGDRDNGAKTQRRDEAAPSPSGPPATDLEPQKPRSQSSTQTGAPSNSTTKKTQSHDNVQRLSAVDMQNLTSSPDSLPVGPAPPQNQEGDLAARPPAQRAASRQMISGSDGLRFDGTSSGVERVALRVRDGDRRPSSPRTASTPPTTRTQPTERVFSPSSPRRYSIQPSLRPPALHLGIDSSLNGATVNPTKIVSPASQPVSAAATPPLPPEPTGPPLVLSRPPSPVPPIIPVPPMSLPTHLQLEMAAGRPSPLYIHQSYAADMPYESSAVKFERLKNVLLLPTYLERTLNFGALACLDAWLYTFTILPIRFTRALGVLVQWWAYIFVKETRWLMGYVWDGLGRLWTRGRDKRLRSPSEVSETMRSRSRSEASEISMDIDTGTSNAARRPSNVRSDSRVSANGRVKPTFQNTNPGPKTGSFRHRRTKSTPSSLSAYHKADLLQGAVIICSSIALMSLDASRMYHFIRAQSAIKLYVIYNILEVSDRLLSALGQDILECLFSTETLSRNSLGRSKILLPLGMFLLALAYNCLHSITLYYQVITLNVAVNSYSNALLTLLLSNQFVEIKSTVFKRIEKDNLFQLTCADIVERFQLWIMLFIIGMRNVVEVGGLSVPGAGSDSTSDDTGPGVLHDPSILPHSFTVLPSWLRSGEVLSPFLIVIASEMLVDTIKHAYVTKFNNIKPAFYSRILDILSKDYYTNAFLTPSLTRRLGLAVIPLSCLFIRASVQTYHMFLSTHLPMPMPPSTQTSLAEESAVPSSPAVIAALNRFDTLIRDSLGRATYGYPFDSPLNSRPWYSWTSDDFIAALTMVVFFFIAFLVLLILKLLLGMVLLHYSRNRYAKMKHKEARVAAGRAEPDNFDTQGRRTGGRGGIEVGEDRQRWIHSDKTEGLKGGKGPGGKRAGAPADDGKKKAEPDFSGVTRFEMVAKRIW